jgi:cysteine desulfurase/selenocysteine lyase
MLNTSLIRQDFPILRRQVHGKQLIYLDNAATSQKPRQVIEAISNYYEQHNANVHRGVHLLSDESTQVWEQSRQTIARFFGATSQNLILTRNTTEALNGIAYGWGLQNLQAGDVVLTTLLEHHSNLVVWQEVCKRTQAQLVFVSVTEAGELDVASLEKKLEEHAEKVKLVALNYVSNTTGAVAPLARATARIRSLAGPQVRIALDAAQAASHMPINFATLDVDFLAFSGHKMLGPMGIGGLLVRRELLDSNELRPWLFGGGMISSVHQDASRFHDDPRERFTAGTPDVASAVGLATACAYLTSIGSEAIAAHDRVLVRYAYDALQSVPDLEMIGPIPETVSDESPIRAGSVAFLYQGVHAHDVAQVLDSEGIAVRSGHHCTMPLHEHFGWQATNRISFQVYNTREEIDQAVVALGKVQKVFS